MYHVNRPFLAPDHGRTARGPVNAAGPQQLPLTQATTQVLPCRSARVVLPPTRAPVNAAERSRSEETPAAENTVPTKTPAAENTVPTKTPAAPRATIMPDLGGDGHATHPGRNDAQLGIEQDQIRALADRDFTAIVEADLARRILRRRHDGAGG